MIKANKQSEYVCIFDKIMVRDKPAQDKECRICGRKMIERKKGVITK